MSKILSMKFADFLSTEMAKRGWSQSDLARQSGLSRQTINYILAGRSKEPDLSTVKCIAEAFDMTVDMVQRRAGLVASEPKRDIWAEETAIRISRLPAESRNLVENLIRYLVDQEKKGKK